MSNGLRSPDGMALACSARRRDDAPHMLPLPASSATSATATPPSASAEAPQRSQRRVGVRCDDLRVGLAWAQALAAEGLQVVAQGVDERAAPPADAVVLHINGHLAAQLGGLRSLRAQAPQTQLLVAVRELTDLDQVLALEMGCGRCHRHRAGRAGGQCAPTCAVAPWRALGRGRVPARAALRRARTAAGCRARHGSPSAPCLLTEGEFEVLWLLALHAGPDLVARRAAAQSARA